MGTVEIIGIALSSSVVVRFVDHLLTRRAARASTTKNQLENIDVSGKTWQNMIDRLEDRIEKLLTQVGSLQQENLELKDDLYKLQSDIATLKQVQKKAERYEKHIKALEERIARYELLLGANNIEY